MDIIENINKNKKNTTQWIFYGICLSIVTLLIFNFSNTALQGSLSQTKTLSGELKSNPDSLYKWKIGNEAPFQYRILHKAIVIGTYSLVKGKDADDNNLFFATYKAWAFTFQLTAVLSFFLFLAVLDFNHTAAFVGSLIFLLWPPSLMAYTAPVHTREDMLAYTLIVVGLITLLKRRIFLFFIISLFGVMCRETLLLLPFIYLFFTSFDRLAFRIVLSAIPCTGFILLRLIIGMPPYDYKEGLLWNVENLDQVIGFTFLTYNVLWIPFLLSVYQFTISTVGNNKASLRLIYKSAVPVLILVMLTTFFGGIFNEIRLLYIFSPWLIPISMSYLLDNWITIKKLVVHKSYLLFIVILSLGFILSSNFTIRNYKKVIGDTNYDIPFHLWLIITIAAAFLTLAAIPVFYKIETTRSNAI